MSFFDEKMSPSDVNGSGSPDVSNLANDISEKQKKLSFLLRNIKKYKKKNIESLTDIIGQRKIIVDIEKKIPDLNDEEIKNKTLMWIKTEKNKMNALNTKLQSEFAMDLYNELQLKGMKLRGHMPKLKVSFYNMDVDFEKNLCNLTYGLDNDHIANLKINPREMSDYIGKVNQDLDKQYGDGRLFQNYLVKAYENNIAKAKTRAGKVSIIDVLMEISLLKQGRNFRINPSRKNYSTYGRIQFSYDIFRLLNDHPSDIRVKLSTATRAQAKNKLNYLWIPKNSRGEGSIFSHIEVVKNQ